METLALGPKNSVLERFDQNDVLAELDELMRYCKGKDMSDEFITDINVKTLAYIKKCKKQKPSRNILLTKRYLKENDLLAVPFDKGIGICLMSKETYETKLKAITDLPQFEKVLPKRKNVKNQVLKEEEIVTTTLKKLLDENKINQQLFEKLKPTGSQAPRIYGLAKVHKTDIPLRPVLSMPGSAYHKIANQVAKWLKVVEECNINTSTKLIAGSLENVHLEGDDEMVSFDVVSLYTNVPVKEAISDCTELLFSSRYKKPPVSKETFKTLTELCTCNVLMLTHDGYYRQVDGLAMGSPLAPLLVNGWLSKFDDQIKGSSILYGRYMDDIIRDIKGNQIDSKLAEINRIHPSLKFTIEREEDNSIPFLDMKISRLEEKLSSTWYTKSTDTGLTMNFHALAPIKYKRSVVAGLVHRIHRSCSSWKNFHESLIKAKATLEKNQFPPHFYEPIIRKGIEKIVTRNVDAEDEEKEEEAEKKLIFVQYRGLVTEKFEQSLQRLQVPCIMINTLKKLKTVLPSLKPPVEKFLKSKVVYKISCSRCDACYVGQTTRHLITRVKEHKRSGPVGAHMRSCNELLTMENVNIIAKTNRSPKPFNDTGGSEH